MKRLLAFIFLVFTKAVLSLSANAATRYAYVKNETPKSASISITNDGPVFGGGTGSASFTVAGGATGNGTGQTDNGIVVEVNISAYDIGGGAPWSNYYCLRYSTVSMADASTKPCSATYKTGAYSATPGGLNATSMYVVISVASAPNCAAGTVSWGPSNFCSASVSEANPSASISVTNAAVGATGSGTAVCSASATWSVTNATCTSSLMVPSTVIATQGTIAGGIKVTWNAVSGASTYEISYRKQGATTWTTASNVASGYQLSTTDEAVFEFMVRGANPAGPGDWSGVVAGYVRPQIMPVFVSQDIPLNVKAGSAFAGTQIWRNDGYTSWATDGSFYIGTATGSADWGTAKGQFSSVVAQGQSSTSNTSFQAPSTPGTYTLSRQFFKSGTAYGAPSAAIQIRVWGDATCSSLVVDSPVVYSVNAVVSVTFAASDQVSSMTGTVWSVSNGTDDQRAYTPVNSAGKFKFDVPLSNHSGFGLYQVRVQVENPVGSATCETQFEFRELALPSLTSLKELVGKSIDSAYVVGQTPSEPFLEVAVARTNNLPLSLEVLKPQGGVVQSASIAAGAPSVNLSSVRWDGAAWERTEYVLRIRYTEAGSETQGKVLEFPLSLILSPAGNQLKLSYESGHPLVAITSLGLGGQSYDPVKQGQWASRVAEQGGVSIDSFDAMSDGIRRHALAYDSLYNATLQATARALPPAGIELLYPLEVTTVAKVPVLPVRSLAASDGTMEDIVRISWQVPAVDGAGFTYDVYRGDSLIESGKKAQSVDDTPPERGVEYTYRVVAVLDGARSVGDASDTGFVPACRAQRLVGASVNADMSRINGLLERWNCLSSSSAQGAVNADSMQAVAIYGEGEYRSFSFPLAPTLQDGSHVLRLALQSEGVVLNATRTYDVPFVLNRASIAVKSLTILYNGATAQPGLEASSIGRFGIKMDGGAGVGFAEEIK